MNQNEVAADGCRCRFVAPWLLRGLATVLGVVLMSPSTMAVAHPPQDPTPLLPPVKVRGLAELQNADRMTENLWASLDRPSDLEVLAAFSHLRGVSIDNITGDGGALWSFEPLAACVSR